MKKFSIIIPHYGDAGMLSKCLASCFDQDWPEKEIIVVLDGENESARRVLAGYPDVKVLQTENERSGAPHARNVGARVSTGDYLLFLDSDSELDEGSLRTWCEKFEEMPNVDFLYSGYKIIDGSQIMTVPSFEFDVYYLKRYNYIDTSNPLRREFIVEWDETLKSFQDWDFWLQIVEGGGVGYFLKDHYFVRKQSPKEGSISTDSHKNWIERRETILKKHNYKISDIAVTSFAAPHHAKRVAKLINADYIEPTMLITKPHKYRLVHLIGIFPENGVNNYIPFFDTESRYFKKDLVQCVHWIGTDVLHTRAMLSFDDVKELASGYNKRFKQFCQSKWNYDSLKEMGFDVELLPLPVDINDLVKPFLPERFSVAIYDHGQSQDDIYCKPLMIDIMKSMPDVQFYCFGDEKNTRKEQNVTYLGRIDIQKVIAVSSCLLRITKHDGYPVTPIEFLACHRPTITNVDMAHTIKIDFNGKFTENTIQKVKRDIISKIRSLKRGERLIDIDAAIKHYKTELNPLRLEKRLESLANEGKLCNTVLQ
jgi:glycosyltransferase involved in cell wall biosynthesis